MSGPVAILVIVPASDVGTDEPRVWCPSTYDARYQIDQDTLGKALVLGMAPVPSTPWVAIVRRPVDGSPCNQDYRDAIDLSRIWSARHGQMIDVTALTHAFAAMREARQRK